MSSLVVFLLLASPAGDDLQSSDSAPRPYHEISRDLRTLMKREALAKTLAERGPAIRQLATLYQEIRRDPRLATSGTLKKYKATLWSRLTRTKKDLEQQIAREKKRKGRESRQAVDDPTQIADQQALQETSQALAAQLALVSYSMGGPARVFADSGGEFGGGAVSDHGEDLVELIERTIQPDFWEVNGGPGAIFYYRPLMALVVSATSEVHEKIGGVVGALRE